MSEVFATIFDIGDEAEVVTYSYATENLALIAAESIDRENMSGYF